MYERIFKQFIIPALGHLKIQDIKPVHVQEFIKQLSNTPCKRRDGSDTPITNTKTKDIQYLSSATIKRYLTVLQSLFRQAVKLGILQSNPADSEKLSLPKVLTPQIQIFTKQEAAEMISELSSEPLQFQVLIQLAILSGCRRGELTSLKFSDFLEHYGFEHRKFHSLRHSSATLLLYGGVNIKQVQGRLGHGSIETTNKYLHCIAEADEQASNVLQDMLISKAPAHEQKQA